VRGKISIKRNSKNLRDGSSVVFFLIFLFYFSFLNPGFSDSTQDNWVKIEFEHITIEDGLSQSTVMSIIQDKEGFLWIATEKGLNRYDGYNFKVYRHDPENPQSLGYSLVSHLYEDHLGYIWAGTMGGGLDKYDKKRDVFIHYRHDSSNPGSISNNSINSIYEDKNGVLWIGTDDGLNRYDRVHDRFIHYKHDPNDRNSICSNRVMSICGDHDGNLWIGTTNGLDKLSGNKFIHYMNGNNVSAVFYDRKGTVWVSTNRGLYRYDRENDTFVSCLDFSKEPFLRGAIYVLQIYEDVDGNLWLTTEGDGLYCYNKKTGKLSHYTHNPLDPASLSRNRVYYVLQDSSGVLWVGTRGGGLSKSTYKLQKFRHIKNDLSDPHSLGHNNVFALLEDREGFVWVGTYNGLYKWDRNKNRFYTYKHEEGNDNSLSNNSVWALFEDKEGNLWIGTSGGLDKLDKKREHFTHYRSGAENLDGLSGNVVLSLYEDENGFLWIGTMSGLDVLNPGTGKFIKHYRYDPSNECSLSNNVINSIYRDSKGNIWIGTFDGLNLFDEKRECFIHFFSDNKNPESLTDNFIDYIFEDSKGRLWIGTPSGLNLYDYNKSIFQHYTIKDGFADDTIYGILEDKEGCLWLSTNRGLTKFNPETKEVENFDVSDGLQDYEFNNNACFKNKRGEMFFGGINGFNVFYPEQIKKNEFIPNIVIVDFKIFNRSIRVGEEINGRVILNKPIEYTDKVILKHTENNIFIEFASLCFVNPEKNQYAYMLKGFDMDWIYSGNKRFATYTNLPPGTYEFLVKGTNSDGVWNNKGVSLTIVITPPFWKTWWFNLIIGLLVLATAFGAHAVRVAALRRRAKLLEELVAERTKELEELNKKLEELSLTDPLTGVANRRHFNKILDLEWKRCLRSKQPLSLVMVDIDYFKLYNDTYGHVKGDICLKKVARVLKENLKRAGDFVARYGGEEFVVILPNTDIRGACFLAETFRTKVEQMKIPHEKSKVSKYLTISLGVASIVPDRNSSYEELLKSADEALYRAKQKSRNCCECVDLNIRG